MATSIFQQIINPSRLILVDELTMQRRWTTLKTLSVEIAVESAMADIPFATSNLSTQMQVDTSLQADLSAGKIIRPTHLRAKLMTDDISIALGIINVFNDVTHQYTITSKEIISEHMSMVDVSILQSPNKLNALDIDILWSQSGLTTSSGFLPGQAGDNSTYGVHVNGQPGLLTSPQALYNKVLTLVGA